MKRPEVLVRGAIAVLILLLLTIIRRATILALTYDEAFTWKTWIEPGWWAPFRGYSANNHVLFSVLAFCTTSLFGLSEFSLRLPSIAAGCVFFITVPLLCMRVFGCRLLAWLVVAAIVLNPFVLDFFAIARGYGLGLAAFVVMLDRCVAILIERQTSGKRWVLKWLAAGVAVAANLTFLVPVTALGLIFSVAWLRLQQYTRTAFHQLTVRFLIPVSFTIGVAVSIPLRHAREEHFFFGGRSLTEMMWSLADVSIAYAPERFALVAPILPLAIDVSTVLGGALLITAAFAAVLLLVVAQPASSADWLTLLVGGTACLSIATFVFLHELLGVLYPLERTGLYFLVLVPLASAGVSCRAFAMGGLWKIGGRSVVAVLGVWCVFFLLQLGTPYFHSWRFDAGARDVANILTSASSDPEVINKLTGSTLPQDCKTSLKAADRNKRSGRVAVTRWLYEPALNFYLRQQNKQIVEPISDDWNGQVEGYDFFVVIPEEVSRLMPEARVLWIHPVSNAVVMIACQS